MRRLAAIIALLLVDSLLFSTACPYSSSPRTGSSTMESEDHPELVHNFFKDRQGDWTLEAWSTGSLYHAASPEIEVKFRITPSQRRGKEPPRARVMFRLYSGKESVLVREKEWALTFTDTPGQPSTVWFEKEGKPIIVPLQPA